MIPDEWDLFYLADATAKLITYPRNRYSCGEYVPLHRTNVPIIIESHEHTFGRRSHAYRQIHRPLCRDHLYGHKRPPHAARHIHPQRQRRNYPSFLLHVPGTTNVPRGCDSRLATGGEACMIPIYGVPTCECRVDMRPRWSRDGGPRVFICQRCGRCVPGYERLWLERQRELERTKKGVAVYERK